MWFLSIFLNSAVGVLREARWIGLFLFYVPARSHALYFNFFPAIFHKTLVFENLIFYKNTRFWKWPPDNDILQKHSFLKMTSKGFDI